MYNKIKKTKIVFGAVVALLLVLAVTAVPKVNGESVEKLISNNEDGKSEYNFVLKLLAGFADSLYTI